MTTLTLTPGETMNDIDDPIEDPQEAEAYYWWTIQNMVQLVEDYGIIALEDLRHEIDKIRKV